MSASTEVLIVGAGPTGLTLACHCARLGIHTRVIDKKDGPRTTPEEADLTCPASEHALGDLLHERGGRVEWGTRMVGLDQGPERVVARLRRAGGAAEEAAAAYLVRCEARDAGRFRNGRVLRAGPTGEPDLITATQDATNLAWKLARVLRGAPEALLDTYEQERLATRREEGEPGPGWWARALRRLFALPMGTISRARKHLQYRASRLSRHEDRRWFGRGGARAGDRAPDVALRRACLWEHVTLFGLLQPLRPVVLVGLGVSERAEELLDQLSRADVDAYLVAQPGSAVRAERCLVDEYGEVERLYGLTGEYLCLVRPDGHIGLVQRPINEAGLGEYLAQIAPIVAGSRSSARGRALVAAPAAPVQ